MKKIGTLILIILISLCSTSCVVTGGTKNDFEQKPFKNVNVELR